MISSQGIGGGGTSRRGSRRQGGTVARRRLSFWQRFAVSLVLPSLQFWTRHTWTGQENLPATGGDIHGCEHVTHLAPRVGAHLLYGEGRGPGLLPHGRPQDG